MGKLGIQIPWWKKLFSYFTDIELDYRSSTHNKDIELLLVRGRLQLCCDDAIYSYDDLYDNFGVSFEKMDLAHPPIHEVLVLGLGLASIPYLLEKVEDKIYNYTAVEIDEEIVDLASTYSLPRLESNVEVICADATHYIMQTDRQWDMIAMDVFKGLEIPEHMMELYFLEELRDLLSPKGFLIMNCMGETESARTKTQSYYDEIFKRVFPNATLFMVKGNFMLISDQDRIAE